MKLKNLLLGATASIVAVTTVEAADLPVKKAAPVEFVRVCSTYGAGFFYIPGTDTCLRVGGRVQYETQYVNTRSYVGARANGDSIGHRGFGRLNLDARTATDLGTVRTFVRFDIYSGNGPYLRSGTAERLGNAFSGTGIDMFGRAQTGVNVSNAFIQFAGITAGRAASFFDFYAHSLEFHASTQGSSVNSTNLLAYTATLGQGLTATISMEDPIYRRQPVYTNTPGTVSGTGTGTITSAPNTIYFSPVPVTFGSDGLPTSFVNVDMIQRERMPDFVGALRLDQAWGSAQLSAAVHEISIGKYTGPFSVNAVAAGAALPGSGATVVAPAGGFTAGGAITGAAATALATNFPVREPDAGYGWGVQGGVKVNLPDIAKGDVLWLQAAYSQGSLSLTGAGTALWARASNTNPVTGRFVISTNDAVVDRFGRLRLTESASVSAVFLHYWTPQVRQAVFGSYAFVDYADDLRTGNGPQNIIASSNAASPAARTTFLFTPTLKDYQVYTAGTNLIYSPVKDLDIGAEFAYGRIDIDGRVNDANKNQGVNPATGVPLKTVSYDDIYLARLRVQRDF